MSDGPPFHADHVLLSLGGESPVARPANQTCGLPAPPATSKVQDSPSRMSVNRSVSSTGMAPKRG